MSGRTQGAQPRGPRRLARMLLVVVAVVVFAPFAVAFALAQIAGSNR